MNKRCIFCKNDSSSAKSIEHIIPESIGSKKRILPKGVVCDKCNNYFARKIEGPLLSHPSMRNLRAWHQVPNKRGTSPSLLGNIGGTDIQVNLRREPNGQLKIETERSTDAPMLQAELESGLPNGILFVSEMNPPARLMSKFLCKMAIETYAETICNSGIDYGFLVDEAFLDNARNFTRYGDDKIEWPYSQRRIHPADTLMMHPQTNKWVEVGFGCTWFMTKRMETFFVFCLYGVEFVINLGGPSVAGYKEWLIENNNISPIVERLGCSLVAKTEGKEMKYYLYGKFDNTNGVEFDRKTLNSLWSPAQ